MMSDSQRFKVGIVGLGDIAQKAYLPIIGQHAHIEPWLCTRNERVLATLAEQYRVGFSTTDYQQLLAKKPDLVMLHSATQVHAEQIEQAINAGVAVFVDKPIAYDYEICLRLGNLAKEKQVPLIVGFNRRFVPLYQQLSDVKQSLIKLDYQKHRHQLPDDARVFIFDDFIHVLDTVLHFGKSVVDLTDAKALLQSADIFSCQEQGKLAAISVRWQHNGVLHCAEMNRVAGKTSESFSAFARSQHWHFDELVTGTHYASEQATSFSEDNWASTLLKRGFVDLIDDTIHTLAAYKKSGWQSWFEQQIDQSLVSHYFAEQLVNRV